MKSRKKIVRFVDEKTRFNWRTYVKGSQKDQTG